MAETDGTYLAARGVEGFWVHVDTDVLDPDLMPAVDYRGRGPGLRVA